MAIKSPSSVLKDIRIIIFDFDGVFTDNTVYVFEDGREAVRCNRADGLGLKRLKDIGLDAMILSTETNPVVLARAEKLKTKCVQGVSNKYEKLNQIINDKGIELSQVAYVGNDINDSECLRAVGLPIVVADAFDEVKKLGAYVTKANGGDGAVREVCDWICSELKNQ